VPFVGFRCWSGGGRLESVHDWGLSLAALLGHRILGLLLPAQVAHLISKKSLFGLCFANAQLLVFLFYNEDVVVFLICKSVGKKLP
jgi:hypothetical protein